jgi:uroporphyrinogen-III synthase
VLEAMQARTDVKGTRGLYVVAEGARDVLPTGLAALGMSVERMEVYRSVPEVEGSAGVRDRLLRGDVDLVTYASASAVQSFVAAVGDAASRAPAACIGPITAAAAREARLTVAVEASSSTIEGLVSAIEAQARRRL